MGEPGTKEVVPHTEGQAGIPQLLEAYEAEKVPKSAVDIRLVHY